MAAMKLALGFLILTTTTFGEQFKVTDQVYLDVEHDGKYIGKIVVGLFGEVAPKTVLNFKSIASVGIDGHTYEGTQFHRVIQRFMIQGGAILKNNKPGPTSIYNGVFEDENFIVKHNAAGFLSMANSGPNTNGCQFFITTMAAPWLDGHHTVFGKVVNGQDVVHAIEHVKTDPDDIPLAPVVIIQSGVMETPSPFYVSDEPYDYSIWAWVQGGAVPFTFSFAILAFFHWALRKLDGCKLV